MNKKQWAFLRNVLDLMAYAHSLGFEMTFGEAYRSKHESRRLAAAGRGVVNSAHTNRLAIDINLFKDGKYLTKTKDHKPLGEYWLTLHKDNRWGGNFRRRDGNHYSMIHKGIA